MTPTTHGDEVPSPAPLRGYRVAVVAHDGRQRQVEAFERLGAEVVVGSVVAAVPAPAHDALEGAIDAVVAGPLDAVVVTSPAGVAGWVAAAEEHRRGQALRRVVAGIPVMARGRAAAAAAEAQALAVAGELAGGEAAQVRQLAVALGGLEGRRVAVQVEAAAEDGLTASLGHAGAEVVVVAVPVPGLPEDREPARRLLGDVAGSRVEALTLTSPAEVANLVALAEETGSRGRLVAALTGEVVVVASTPASQASARAAGVEGVVVADPPRLGAMVEVVVEHVRRRRQCLILAGVAVRVAGALALVGDTEVWLADRERALLAALIRRPGAVVAKSELLQRVWRSTEVDAHAVEVAVGRLRRRLGPAGAALETVPRRGYRLVAD